MGSTSAAFDSRIPPEAKIIDYDHPERRWIAWREEGKGRKLASAGHIIFLLTLPPTQPPLDSVNQLSPADIPVLSDLLERATHLLYAPDSDSSWFNAKNRPTDEDMEEGQAGPSGTTSTNHVSPPQTPSTATRMLQQVSGAGVSGSPSFQGYGKANQPLIGARIGFVGGMFKDPLSTGHGGILCHALLGPLDLASFYSRNGPFGSLGWWELSDLIAEIREESTNNRVKSGGSYTTAARPLHKVKDAGSVVGRANGTEVEEPAATHDERV